MFTEKTTTTNYSMKKNWQDFKVEKRELATKKRLGDYLDNLSLLNEDIIIEILKQSEKEYSQIFTIKEYLNEEDGLTRKELFKFIYSLEENVEELATGEYIITYKVNAQGQQELNEKGEPIVEKKVAEIITIKRNITVTLE